MTLHSWNLAGNIQTCTRTVSGLIWNHSKGKRCIHHFSFKKGTCQAVCTTCQAKLFQTWGWYNAPFPSKCIRCDNEWMWQSAHNSVNLYSKRLQMVGMVSYVALWNHQEKQTVHSPFCVRVRKLSSSLWNSTGKSLYGIEESMAIWCSVPEISLGIYRNAHTHSKRIN